MRTDPHPDLALEVDVSHSSMNRMSIYAALRIPEVWRYDRTGLAFFGLDAGGEYLSLTISQALPLAITPADLMQFIDLRGHLGVNVIIQKFRTWLRAKIAAAQP